MVFVVVFVLLYDVFFIVMVFSLIKLEVDLMFIVVVLMIVGYLINDMIVMFDCICENM